MILDNAISTTNRFHRIAYLASYSPMTNPIELVFNSCKAALKLALLLQIYNSACLIKNRLQLLGYLGALVPS